MEIPKKRSSMATASATVFSNIPLSPSYVTNTFELKRKVSKTEMPLQKNILPVMIYVGADTTFYNRFSIIIILA
jgi:hypothetical protein